MKVLQPLQNNEIVLIPRYYPSGLINLYLTNEATKEIDTYNSIEYTISNGKLNLTLTKQANEKDRFVILIKEGEEIVYRGKAICTAQATQNFKQSNNVFRYEF